MSAPFENRSESVTALLSAGADIKAVDENGFTPLHLAAACGDHETIEVGWSCFGVLSILSSVSRCFVTRVRT